MRRLYITILIALDALFRNLLRAILTTLGIVIGIAAVIAMMEIGSGSATAIQRTIAAMGAHTILILPGTAASGGVSWGSGTEQTLVAEDAEAVRKELPAVLAVAPIVRVRAQIAYGAKNWVPMNIYGTTPEYLIARDWDLAAGEEFSDRDVRSAYPVCLIGETIVRELFGDQSPLGQELKIQNVSFRVIGVLKRKGANMMGSDQDDTIIAPWTTIKFRVSGTSSSATSTTPDSKSALYPSSGVALYPTQSESSLITPSVRKLNVDQIIVAVRSATEINGVMKEVGSLLRQRHRIRNGESDDFNIRDMTEMSKALTSTTTVMTRLLLVVALISLVVGGVGIMNIMLVSVTERTREIGLRMAVGATGKDILQQFLIEAVILCLAGGTLGLLLGKSISALVRILFSWPVESSLAAVVSAIGVSAAVGVIFGFYPAWKAARLDPIEALRYE